MAVYKGYLPVYFKWYGIFGTHLYKPIATYIKLTACSRYSIYLSVVWSSILTIIAVLYYTYFAYCMFKTFSVDDEGSMRLLIVTVIATVFIVARLITSYILGDKEFNLKIFDEKQEDARLRKIKAG